METRLANGTSEKKYWFPYYGEEIGHTGSKPDENIHTPMQWTDGDNAGFTTATTAWRGFQRNYQEANVAVQTDDADSLLSHHWQLIHTRNAHAALRVGDRADFRVHWATSHDVCHSG